jgi:hypothetical protein
MPAQGRPGHHDTVGPIDFIELLKRLPSGSRSADLNRRLPEGSRDMKIGPGVRVNLKPYFRVKPSCHAFGGVTPPIMKTKLVGLLTLLSC